MDIRQETIALVNKIENDSALELKNKYAHRPAAWLYWPASIPEYGDELHITLKWFGDSPVTVDEIASELFGTNHVIDAEKLKWKPSVFDTKNDGPIPVLELIEYPNWLTILQSRFTKYRQDDYPAYRPHITVSDQHWNSVGVNKYQPSDVGMTIGDLRLKMPSGRRFVFKVGLNKYEELPSEDMIIKGEREDPPSSTNVISAIESLITGRKHRG